MEFDDPYECKSIQGLNAIFFGIFFYFKSDWIECICKFPTRTVLLNPRKMAIFSFFFPRWTLSSSSFLFHSSQDRPNQLELMWSNTTCGGIGQHTGKIALGNIFFFLSVTQGASDWLIWWLMIEGKRWQSWDWEAKRVYCETLSETAVFQVSFCSHWEWFPSYKTKRESRNI